MPPIPLIPENAPFSPAQRAWLNGFLAGLYGGAAEGGTAAAAVPVPDAEPDEPWHDPALEPDERMALAEGRTLPQRLMAAMAQLDCGQCGYLCRSYGEAIAAGTESSLSLCVPGAKTTSRLLKAIVAEAPAKPTAADAKPAAAAKPAGPELRPVRVLHSDRITAAGSAKDVRHVVIDLAGSGLEYDPGDSLGLVAPNDPVLVERCLAALGTDENGGAVLRDGREVTLRDALSRHLDIARPLDATLDLLAMSATEPREAALLRRLAEGEDGAEPADADLLDLLEHFPSARPSLGDLLQSLPTLKPRLYSIASSPRAVPGRVELCVSVVRSERRGRMRNGIASSFLGDRARDHGPVDGFVQRSHFRLPRDPMAPVIMCGPGTGIAPFRAFLQERERSGAKGRTWLFFGDQHEASDFLFRDELRGWLGSGVLSRLDTAFSRDAAKKVYVQDRMLEHAAELWRWFQDGACFYVCGDASRMARDVDNTLRRIAAREGRLDEDQTREWMAALGRQGRYHRDVY
ncbi:MAG: sulfite reductase subunit alpha [Gluconacetobacter diazotrophicus]|nr:sulfite reductase subunit alpha [Gluconacetobacter diazotrophicus]